MKNSCDGCNAGMEMVTTTIDFGDYKKSLSSHYHNGLPYMACTKDRYNRMSQHRVFTDVAKSIANLSKCVSMAVGCVAVNERGRIVSTGVNGTASGHVNCCDVHESRGDAHSAWSEQFEIHAEMNCILEMSRSTTRFNEVSFYVTHCPCSNCLKHMIGLIAQGVATVKRIVYNEIYYKTSAELLAQNKAYCNSFGVDLLSVEEIEAK